MSRLTPIVVALVVVLWSPWLPAQVAVELTSPFSTDPTWQLTGDDGFTDPDLTLQPCQTAAPAEACATPLSLGQEQCLPLLDADHPPPVPPEDGYCVEPVDCRFTSRPSCAGLLFIDTGRDLRGAYVSFAVTNIGTNDYSDVWVTLSGFGDDDSDGQPQLVRVAPFEAVNPQDPMDQWYAARRIGPLSPGRSAPVFFLLEVSDPRQPLPSNAASRPEVTVWNGRPSFPFSEATNIIRTNDDSNTCLNPINGAGQPTLVGNGLCDDGAFGATSSRCVAGTDRADCTDPAVMDGAPRSPWPDCADPDRARERPCRTFEGGVEWPFIYNDTIETSANRILSLSLSDQPIVGGTVDVIVSGDAGRPGLVGDLVPGDAGDPEALLGLSPTGLAAFPSRALRLVGTTVVVSGPEACGRGLDCSCSDVDVTNCEASGHFLGCETRDVNQDGVPDNTCIVNRTSDRLAVVLEEDTPVLTRATYTFRPTEVRSPTPILPLQYIVSGRQFKHTTATGLASCLFDTGVPCPSGVADCEAALPGFGASCSAGSCLVLDTSDPNCACNEPSGDPCDPTSAAPQCGSWVCNPTTSSCSDLACLPPAEVSSSTVKDVTPPLAMPGEEASWTVTVTNHHPIGDLDVDEILDRLPAPPSCSGADAPCGPMTPTYVANSSAITSSQGNVRIPDPLIVGSDLIWPGPWTLPPGDSITLHYRTFLWASPGLYRNAALGLVGSLGGSGGSGFDATGAAPQNLPDDPCTSDLDCALFGPGFRCRDRACILPATADLEVESLCGNGAVDNNCAAQGTPPLCEECDDGGASATCDIDCTFAGCPDGVVNTVAGEICDQGGDTTTCDGDCTPAECGDGYVNPAAGELCDCGSPDNLNPGCNEPNGGVDCELTCRPPVCGDGIHNPLVGEECDDGDLDNGDGCTTGCTLPMCGDGFVQAGNFVPLAVPCDPANGDLDCLIADLGLAARCLGHPTGGDLCHLPEVCDCGTGAPLPRGCDDYNGPASVCSPDCQMDLCGDGRTSPGCSSLPCDDGTGGPDQAICDVQFGLLAGGGPAYLCSPLSLVCEPHLPCITDAECQAAAGASYACEEYAPTVLLCQQQPPACEECDDPLNPQLCTPGPAGCDQIRCGDGELDPGESCDPAILDPDKPGFATLCDPVTCDWFCGDGDHNPGEECDDGNGDDRDGCSALCALEPAAVDLVKNAQPTLFDGPGQTISYTLTVTNAGATDLVDLVVVDPLLPALDCGGVGALPVGATATCTGAYLTTQPDVDLGRIDNTAEVTARVADGRWVGASAGATVTTDQVFADDFETGDVGRWSAVVPP